MAVSHVRSVDLSTTVLNPVSPPFSIPISFFSNHLLYRSSPSPQNILDSLHPSHPRSSYICLLPCGVQFKALFDYLSTFDLLPVRTISTYTLFYPFDYRCDIEVFPDSCVSKFINFCDFSDVS